MAIVTIRPDATVISTMTRTGAASTHVAVNDNSDASYIEAPYGQFSQTILGLPDYVFPANSFLKQVRIRLRYRTIDPHGWANITYWVARLVTSTGYYGIGDTQSTVTSSILESIGAWRTKAPSGLDWTQAEVNALRVDLYPGYYNGNVEMPRIYEVYVDLDFNTTPVGAITTPVNNSTETVATRPSMTFTYSDAEGDAMEGYQAKLFTLAQYNAAGFNPDTSTATYDTGKVGTYGPITVMPPFDLNNGTTYRWYLWVYQQGGPAGTTGYGVSLPVYSQFLVNVTTPALPVITPEESDFGGYVTLTINSGGGTPATSTILVERSQDGGTTWSKVRGTPVAPGTTLIDFEVVPNKAVIYRGRSTAANGVASLFSAPTAPVTTLDNEWRLRDPLDSSSNIILSVTDDRMVQRKPEDKAFFAPMGRTRKVSVADVIRGEESQFTLEFLTQEAFDAFEKLRDSQRTLFLTRGWTSEGWYISFDQILEMTLYNYFPTYRTVTIAWVEVDAP